MSFGERLRELRISANLTQEQLAKKVKLSKANISKYEADLVEPNIDTLKLLSIIFNVSTDYLLEKTNIKRVGSSKKLTNIQADYYNREEFKDLTQDEVDTLAVLAKTLKEKRKKQENETVTIAVAARSKNDDESVKIIKVLKKDLDILDIVPESDEIL